MKRLINILPVLFAVAAMVLTVSPAVMAETDNTNEGAESRSALQNDAQVARAENLAEIEAAKPDAELTAARKAVTDAETALAAAKASGDENAIDDAQAALDEADGNLATLMSARTAEAKEDITAMRASGMGWGEIAHELGIHPGYLGLGHTKGNIQKNRFSNMEGDDKAEIKAATERNLKTGWAMGHGKNLNDDGTGAKSKGLDNRGENKGGGGKGHDGGKGDHGGGKGKN